MYRKEILCFWPRKFKEGSSVPDINGAQLGPMLGKFEVHSFLFQGCKSSLREFLLVK